MEPPPDETRRLLIWTPVAALAFGFLSYGLWSMAEANLEHVIGSNAAGHLFASQLFGSPLTFALLALYGSRAPFDEGFAIAASYAVLGIIWTFWLCKRQYHSELAVVRAYALAFIWTLLAVTVLGLLVANAILR